MKTLLRNLLNFCSVFRTEIIISAFSILIVLFEKTYLSVFIYGLIAIIILFYELVVNKNRLIKTGNLVFTILLSLLIIGQAVSAIFSVSKPISMDYIFVNIFAWLLAVFFCRNKSLLNEQRIGVALFVMTVLLMFLNILSSVLPVSHLKWIPNLNLFHPIVGHNHIAAWLLIINPVILFKFFSKKSWWYFLSFFIVALFTVFSFGRIAILIFIIQTLIYLFINRKQHNLQTALSTNKKNLRDSKVINWLFVAVTVLSLIGFAFIIYISLFSTLYKKDNCLPGSLDNQLCKRLDHEGRIYYWQQAVQIFQHNFLVGSGPGTYGQIYAKYSQTPSVGSGFAHNHYLEGLAETGLVGWLPLMMMLTYLLTISLKISKNEPNSFNFAVFVAVVSSMTNAFFDFDFTFNTIYLTNIVFLIYLVRQNQSKSRGKNLATIGKTTINLATIDRAVFWLLTSFVIIYFIAFVCAESLIRTKQIDKAFKYFPFFKWHEQIYFDFYKKPWLESHSFANIPDKNDQQKIKNYFGIYTNNKKNLQEMVELSTILQEKNYYLEKIYQIDLWYEINNPGFEYYLISGQLDKAINKTFLMMEVVNSTQNKLNFSLSFSQYKKLFEQMLLVADSAYKNHRYQQAGEIYALVQKNRLWILDEHQPAFLNTELSADQIEFIYQIQHIDPEQFGQFRRDYADYFLNIYLLNTEQGILSQKLFLVVDVAEKIAPWQAWEMRSKSLAAQSKLLDSSLLTGLINQPTKTYEQEKIDFSKADLIVDYFHNQEKATVADWDYFKRKEIYKKIYYHAELAYLSGDFARTKKYLQSLPQIIADYEYGLTAHDDFIVFEEQLVENDDQTKQCIFANEDAVFKCLSSETVLEKYSGSRLQKLGKEIRRW